MKIQNLQNKVYSFGKGELLGINVEYDGLNLNKPTLVPLLTGKKISHLACGANHTLVLQGAQIIHTFFYYPSNI